MTEYSRLWGRWSMGFFRMLWSPIFPKKPSTSRVRQDRPNTEHPKNKKSSLWSQMELPCMASLPKPWSGRIEKCHVFAGILFCSFIHYLFSIGRFNSDSHDHDIWIAAPPSLVGFLIGESDLKTAFWSLDFPTKNSPLARLQDGKMLSLKKALGTDCTNIVPFLGQAG